jgi:hypothetical protein
MALIFGINKRKPQTFKIIHWPSGDELTIQTYSVDGIKKSSTAFLRMGIQAGMEFKIIKEKEDGKKDSVDTDHKEII